MSVPNDEHDMKDSEERLEAEMAEVMGRWSDDQQRQVDEAVRAASDEDRAAAARSFESLAGPRSTRSRQLLWLAAALLVGLTLGYFRPWSAPQEERPVLFGPTRILTLFPIGEVENYNRFQWSLKSEEPARFGLRVWNAGELDPVIEVDGLEASPFVPTEAQLSRLGPGIEWQVILQSAEGATLSAASSSASLRSP